jgi:hypothetical protein
MKPKAPGGGSAGWSPSVELPLALLQGTKLPALSNISRINVTIPLRPGVPPQCAVLTPDRVGGAPYVLSK